MSRLYKILVAEDNELLRELLSVEVQEYLMNVSITEATDGLQAMHQAMDQSFDLIISDNVMPGMLGSVLLREVRARVGPNRDTPFIFCSGNFSVDEIKGLTQCHVLQKPFDMRRLHALLARLFQLQNPHFA